MNCSDSIRIEGSERFSTMKTTPPMPECHQLKMKTQKSDGSQQTLGSVLSLCYKEENEEEDEGIGEELTLVDLGFSISKYLNWDGVSLPEKTSLDKAMHYRLTNYMSPDCIVIIGEKIEYRCHLLLLQCYSSFFDRQNSLQPISLPPEQVAPSTFEFIYLWMLEAKGDCYSMIRRDHIINLLIAARFLEISELEQQCKETIRCEKFFTEGSAFILYLMARDKGLKDIQQMLVPRIRKFFLSIVCSLDFLKELNAEDVCSFLSSDHISVHSELEVFMIAMRWLLYQWPERKPHVREIMSCIRFGLIAPRHLVNIRRNTFCKDFSAVISADPIVLKMMDDGVAYSITKGWQEGEGEEFETSVAQQGLVKPKLRNWAARDKNCEYENYEDFLKELARRRAQMIAKPGIIPQEGRLPWLSGDPDAEIRDDNKYLTELTLTELGFRVSKYLDWKKSKGFTEKSNLYDNIRERVRNFVHADCVVAVGDDFEYNCHLLLLQCYSHVCSSKFEKKQIRLSKENVTARGFELTYQWMLADTESAHFILRRDVLLEVYATALCLEVKELVALCWATISSTKFFYEGTAFLLYLMAKERGMNDVQQLMAPRIGKFFLTLVSSKDFLDLDISDICAFLGSDNICVHSEIEVFMSAVRWLRHDWRLRKNLAAQVMSCIRFGLIPAWQLIDIRRNPENPEFLDVTGLPEVDKMIDNGLACSIVKEYYTEDNEKNFKSMHDQGISLPGLRNWYDLKKDYLTYRDFLRELNLRRKEHLEESRMQKTGILRSQRKMSREDSICPTPPTATTKFLQMDKKDFQVPLKEKFTENYKNGIRNLEKRETNISESNFQFNKPEPNTKDNFPATEENQDEVFSEASYNDSDTERPPTAVESHKKSVQQDVESIYDIDSNAPSPSRSIIGPAQKGSILLTSPRRESVLIFGGTDPFQRLGSTSNNGCGLLRYNTDKNIWDLVGELPQPRHHHATVVCRNRVYVIGGTDPSKKDSHGRSIVVSTVWSLDIKNRIWFRETDMNETRKDLGAVEVGGKILAIGGRNKDGKVLRTVEKYDPHKRKWDEAPPLNKARYAMGVAYHDNSIWVVGGTARNADSTNSVERLYFNDNKNRLLSKWAVQPPLRIPRSFCSLVSTGADLYIIGGVHGTCAERTSIPDVDVWNNREWKLRFSLNIPRHCQTVATLGSNIMIIGGVSTTYQACLSDVQVFCHKRQILLPPIKALPYPLSGHAAVTLQPTDSYDSFTKF